MVHSTMRHHWAVGGTIFAGTAMIIIGFFQSIMGFAALAQDQIFVANAGYVYGIDTTAWGWVHLGLGLLLIIAGAFIYTRAMWARSVGIALAALSAIGNFFFLPYYPLWSMVIIALDIFVIWALATVVHRVEATSGSSMPQSEATRDWSQVDQETQRTGTAARHEDTSDRGPRPAAPGQQPPVS